MTRRVTTPLAVAVIGAGLLLVPSYAAEPASGTVGPGSTDVAWNGTFVAPDAGALCVSEVSCDSYRLTVDPGPGADVEIAVSAPGDIDLRVYDDDGTEVGASESPGGEEVVVLDDVAAGTYVVVAAAYLVDPGTSYEGRATLTVRPEPTATDEGGVAWHVDPDAPQASAEAPLRVVAVGFDPGELDEEAVFAEIPDTQRPGVLIPYGGGESADRADLAGADTLVNHGRAYYDDAKPFLVPVEVRWKPELVYAPDAFTDALFAEMMRTSRDGDYTSDSAPIQREYLELYNATRGLFRVQAGGQPVLPGRPVRFIDGEATEDWIADNGERLLGFHAGKDPGVAGYTVFLLNTWDSPAAREHFPADQYHHFFIDRPDPDTGSLSGIDWARIWGGRYRFMMVDLGAAPNAYESETWANRRRTVLGSALYDPPLWEYRANAPRIVTAVHLADGTEQAVTPGATWDAAALLATIARTVNQAVSFRFLHSYLYEPRPGNGRFFLSDNIWHDAAAELPWASDLTKLYDQSTALAGLSSLTPYFEFDGDVQFEYLSDAGDPNLVADQAALDAAKLAGDDIAGVPHAAMNTISMMDYIDAHADRFLRGGDCFTTVPTVQVVVPAHYAWSLPAIVAGIAVNRDGVPWGFLNSVNDVFKWPGADKDPTMALAHPDLIGGGAFTYTTIHEASHYLGLAHPHDAIGAVRGVDGEPVYYDGFTWVFDTTAAPTTYSHAEIVYSILDQETIARGHLAYYLRWTDDALGDAGRLFAEQGVTAVADLPAAAATLRADAVQANGEAERLFGEFRFVDATFAAQRAWNAAAALLDLAAGDAPGTAAVSRATQGSLGASPDTCAGGTAAPPAEDGPGHDHSTHPHPDPVPEVAPATEVLAGRLSGPAPDGPGPGADGLATTGGAERALMGLLVLAATVAVWQVRGRLAPGRDLR